jgi:ketosteroid isomerase-like protein
MAQTDNIAIAQEFLRRLGSGGDPATVAELFTENMKWDIPGDESAFPWIGRQSGRQAILSFLAETAEKIERIRLDIDDILASDTRVVILGSLASRVKQTGKVIETFFAIILTIADGQIIRFQMLEDSFAVSRAA